MTLSLFKNLYSKEASGEISVEQLVNAIREGVFREQVERFRQLKSEGRKDEAAAVKRGMMAVTFSGVCKQGRSFELTTERTGWAMFDFDGLKPGLLKPLKEVMKACPWVVMVFVTVSGMGLRVVANIGIVDKGDFTKVYVAAADRLKMLAGAQPDMQCKDFARLSVMSFDPDIYYNPEAEVFDYVPAPQRISVDDIIRRFFSRNTYVEGSRHRTLLKLGRYLRWWKLDLWEVETALSRVMGFATGNGVTEKEVRKAVLWGYENGTEGRFTTNLGSLGSGSNYNKGIFDNKQRSEKKQEAETELDEEEIMEASCKRIPDRVYENLPESIIKLTDMANDEGERDMILLSLICMMSGIFSNFRTMYGNKLYSPHLFVAILANAGTGKGVVSSVMRLGDAINNKLAQRYAIEKSVYDKKNLEWELEKKIAMKEKRVPNIEMCPVPPKRQTLKNQPNMSKSQFMLSMMYGISIGKIICTSEIDTMSSALSTDYGQHLPELRMAFHHEAIGQYYKVDNEPVEIDYPMLAIGMTGTIEQFIKFVPNIHDGMFSRFLFYLSNRSVVWKSQSPLEKNGDVDISERVKELDEKLCAYFFEEEGNLVLVNFSAEQWQRHREVFSELLNMIVAECDEGMEAIVTRGGLIAMRVAMVLCGVRIMEAGWKSKSYFCSDEDFDAAMDIVTSCMKHSIQLSTVYNNENKRKKMENFFQKLKVLKSMGDLFTYTEFLEKGIKLGFSRSSMKRSLKRYLDAGIVEKVGNRYSKVKGALRDDLYDDGICEV